MIFITKEQRLLLDLLSGEITGTNKTFCQHDFKEIDWDTLLKEAKQQAVPLMLAEAIIPYKEYISDYKPWQYTIAYAIRANVCTANYEQELNELMGNHPFFILKGMAAASYYPMPQQRMLGDIDFLIDAFQKDEITHLLEQNGYKSRDMDHICHVVFRKSDAHLEMHFEISGIPFGKQGEIIREFMKDALSNRHIAQFDGWSFPAPDELYHGVVILLHMQHHMLGEGLGMRHLCDWACFVQKTQNQAFWNELLDLYKKVGLLTYAQVMTKTCSIYFGTVFPEWAKEAEDSLCYDVMSDILTGGNFGRKDNIRSKSGMMISEHGKSGTKRGKITNLFNVLHHSTPVKYPIVKKCPMLYPFLDFCRVIHYMAKVLTGKRPSITKMVPMAQQRRSIYERLHVFEVNE